MKDDNPNYYGFKVSRGYASATVWMFRKKDYRLIGTVKRTCNKGMPKAERVPEIASFLNHFGLSLE